MNTQEQAIGFTKGTPFSNGYVAGHTLYIAGQQGPDSNGKENGADIFRQTTNINEFPTMKSVYNKLMPDPKPARAAVQVAGLIGGAKIEISAIAVKH